MGTKKSYKMETRLITDPKTRKVYENKLMVLSEELATIANDITVLKSNRNKGELFVGASTKIGSGVGDGKGEMSGEEAGSHMISDMNTIQDKTKASITNTKQMVSASKAVGESKTFGKRMATDRFIQCFACINVLLLVGVVVYTIVKKGNTGNSSSGNPTNPVGGTRLLRGWLIGEDDVDEEEEEGYVDW